MTLSRGIDVSHHQGRIDWPAIARELGITWAACKATEGQSFVDSEFARNWAGMKSAGLVRMAYHFGRPGGDAAAQVKRFLSVVNPVAGDVLCLDLEQSDGLNQSQVNAWARAFGIELRKSAPGNTTVIYLGGYAANGSGANLSDHFDYWWYPRYATMKPVRSWPGSFAPRLAGNTTGWEAPHIWQWACSLATSEGPVDANISLLSAAQLRDGPRFQEDDITDDDIKKIALEVWRYDQQGAKSQAWAYLQRGATPPTAPAPTVNVPVVTQETLEAALRNVIAEMVGSK